MQLLRLTKCWILRTFSARVVKIPPLLYSVYNWKGLMSIFVCSYSSVQLLNQLSKGWPRDLVGKHFLCEFWISFWSDSQWKKKLKFLAVEVFVDFKAQRKIRIVQLFKDPCSAKMKVFIQNEHLTSALIVYQLRKSVKTLLYFFCLSFCGSGVLMLKIIKGLLGRCLPRYTSVFHQLGCIFEP